MPHHQLIEVCVTVGKLFSAVMRVLDKQWLCSYCHNNYLTMTNQGNAACVTVTRVNVLTSQGTVQTKPRRGAEHT